MFKLLIADDEPIVLEALTELLACPDYDIGEILTASNGEAALSLFHSGRPDIVVTDVRMPRMDGIEFITRIRACDESTSIIIFSAYSEFEYARKAISLNVVDYLLKPIHLPDFDRTIRRVVERLNTSQACLEEAEKHPAYKQVVCDVMDYAKEHFHEDITLASIAEKLFIDYHYLSKLFKKETGMLFSAYLTDLRMSEAKKLLKSRDAKIYEVSASIGYRDVKYFRKLFKELESLTPSEYHQMYT